MQTDKIRTLSLFIGISILVHLVALFSIGRFGQYSFATLIKPPPVVVVDLTQPGADIDENADTDVQKTDNEESAAENITEAANNVQEQGADLNEPPPLLDKSPTGQKLVDSEKIISEYNDKIEPPLDQLHAVAQPVAFTNAFPAPLRKAEEFMTTKSEKLSYLITLLGVPVGNAELEAKVENGELRVTFKTRSNAAMSNVYPVDDLIETRHIAGNFIITKIRQNEGDFKSDIGFTIFLRDKRVFWIDRIRNRYSNETIPNSEVLDSLSSIYYMRSLPLQVGKTETLHIYDGDAYAPVPFEILRQEEIRLRNFKKMDTLLLRHIQQKGGIFRRTGDKLIWLSNDKFKVPVRMETSTPLGNITLELVSAESTPVKDDAY